METMRSRLRVGLLALLAALALWPVITGAYANGGGVYLIRTAGPYEVTLLASPPQPRVGNWHVTLAVRDVATGEVVRDATIRLVATPPPATSPEPGLTDEPRTLVATTAFDPRFYDMNIPLDRTGSWTMDVTLDSARGEARFQFLARVVEGGVDLQVIIMIAAGLPIFVALSWITLRWGRERIQKRFGHRRM